MGIFDFLKKKTQPSPYGAALKIQGPEYLRKHLVQKDNTVQLPLKWKDRQRTWTGQLVSAAGGSYFELYYHGKCDNDRILGTNDSILRVVAVSLNDGEEIVVFDNTRHGWDGYIGDAYSEQEDFERKAVNKFTSSYGTLQFRIYMQATYNHGTESELMQEAENGHVTLMDGSMVAVQDAFDNAFDVVSIYAVDENDRIFEIVSEELA